MDEGTWSTVLGALQERISWLITLEDKSAQEDNMD
jgi:hypothetical protein